SQRNIKIPGRYADSVLELNIRECLARSEEDDTMNDMKIVKEDYSQNSISNEDIEQNKVNEEMVGQGVNGGCMENESEFSTEKDGYDIENEIVSDERNSKKNEDGVKEIHENNEAQNKNRSYVVAT
ncbi:hypothetical protein Tco_0539608, partial [Tanacetum coccineum]